MACHAADAEGSEVGIVTAIQTLLYGDCPALVARGCAIQSHPAHERLIFPGSFAPWHEGHRRLAETAARQLHSSVAYEMSLLNVDKPPLVAEEVVARLRQFPACARIWLTRAATFVEKAQLFPGTVFLVGADTMHRIADPSYYDGSTHARDEALSRLVESGCRFLVFGRLIRHRFHVLSDLDLPCTLRGLCMEVPERDFRVDISSTEIRSSR
jgi:nicotinic acid mononucleotide adenylyltransferase